MTSENGNTVNVCRGDVFWILAEPEDRIGAELRKIRPGVVVQNDIGNRFSECTIVVLVSAAQKKPLPTHVPIKGRGELKDCTVMAEQIYTVDKSRIGCKLAHLTDGEMAKIAAAMADSLGLEVYNG